MFYACTNSPGVGYIGYFEPLYILSLIFKANVESLNITLYISYDINIFMEETKELEPKVRTKISQIANGQLRFEATTRGDTVEEAILLLKEAKKQLEELCK